MEHDFERSRLDYAQRLESELQVAHAKIAELTAKAVWMPQFGITSNNGSSTITMELKGKRQSIAVDLEMVAQFSQVDLTTAVFDAFKPLIEDAFKPAIQEQLAPVQSAAARLSVTPTLGQR